MQKGRENLVPFDIDEKLLYRRSAERCLPIRASEVFCPKARFACRYEFATQMLDNDCLTNFKRDKVAHNYEP